MGKESGSERRSSKDVQDTTRRKAPADSGQAGVGSELFHINEQGEYCFGTQCFQMRIKPGSGEVRVIVDRNECSTNAQEVVDALFGEVIKGAPTVYESKSRKEK